MTVSAPVADAHIHLPGPPASREEAADAGDLRVWAETQAAVRPRYALEDFRRDTIGQNIRRIVHVATDQIEENPVAETLRVQRIAEEHGAPHAIVAAIDPAAPDFGALLDEHADASSLLRGVSAHLPDAGAMDDPAWRRGVGLLGKRKLVLELHVTPALMPRTLKLADAHRDVSFILCHAGYPPKLGERSETTWRAGIRALADCPNVVVKVSGLASNEGEWNAGRFHQMAGRLVDAFGPARVMVGSNFPAERDFVDADILFAAFREWIADLPSREQAAILYENACRIYRMP